MRVTFITTKQKELISLVQHMKKNNCDSYLNFYKHFVHFEVLASNTAKNETKEKFNNFFRINLVKYSSKFLAHI